MSQQTFTQALVRRDTRAWRLQSWVSFGLAVTVCGSGLAYLPGTEVEVAFMVMGYVFCLSAVFGLSKFVRDQALRGQDTPLWSVVVWSGFALAVALTGWGLARMQINPSYKAYLVVSWLFLVSTAFTLAKMLRDDHEAQHADRAERTASITSQNPQMNQE
jgi:hypothetical protein